LHIGTSAGGVPGLVVATYGRGVWDANIAPLQGIDSALLSSEGALLPIRSVSRARAVNNP
jgi:hypothetical protein